MQSSNIDDPLTSNLRVATFSIAAFDYLQTIPGEIKLYRRQYAQGRMSIVCFLFIVVRYVSIVSLVLNGIGFYSNTFDIESCRKFRLAPPVTKMIAGFASQGLIFLRTWAISRKSRTVLIFLSIMCVITVPMMVIGNVYKRDPFIKKGTQKCIAKQLDETAFNSAPMYYGAMAGFDIIACAVATYYLIDRNSGSTMSKFTKKVLQHGMMYAFGTTLVNIVVLLGTSHVRYVEKLGAFFSVAVTMIMAQHLVLATQSARDESRSFVSSRPLNSSTNVSGSGPTTKRTGTFATDTFELGVRVHTETIHAVEPQRLQSATGSVGTIGTVGDIEEAKRPDGDWKKGDIEWGRAV